MIVRYVNDCALCIVNCVLIKLCVKKKESPTSYYQEVGLTSIRLIRQSESIADADTEHARFG